jgi:hypothetical protein
MLTNSTASCSIKRFETKRKGGETGDSKFDMIRLSGLQQNNPKIPDVNDRKLQRGTARTQKSYSKLDNGSVQSRILQGAQATISTMRHMCHQQCLGADLDASDQELT